MGRNSITIEDVASAARVSRQTVSRVINQKTNVSAAARTRVEAAIEELGYVPNLAARRMGGAGSQILLALIERSAVSANGGHVPLGEAMLGEAMLGEVMLAGMDACSAQGYHLLFEQIEAGDNSSAVTTKLNTILGAVQPDGVILLPPLDENTALREALAKKSVKTRALGQRVEKGRTLYGLDETAFGEAAAQRLIALGHRQVAFMSGMTQPKRSHQRLEGYRRALARSRSRAQRHFVAQEALDYAGAQRLAQSWLEPTIRPTAIIAETSEVALACLHVARDMRIAVPGDLSILSLEDHPSLERAAPKISALHQPYGAMFADACKRLMPEGASERAEPKTAQSAKNSQLVNMQFIEGATIAKAPRAV